MIFLLCENKINIDPNAFWAIVALIINIAGVLSAHFISYNKSGKIIREKRCMKFLKYLQAWKLSSEKEINNKSYASDNIREFLIDFESGIQDTETLYAIKYKYLKKAYKNFENESVKNNNDDYNNQIDKAIKNLEKKIIKKI